MQFSQIVQQFDQITLNKNRVYRRNLPIWTTGLPPSVGRFNGGQLTKDGGVIVVAQIDQHYRINEQVAACFEDQREFKFSVEAHPLCVATQKLQDFDPQNAIGSRHNDKTHLDLF